MKILHIVPSAFEYFGEIRERAFDLIEGLSELGFDNYVFTLQYGTVTKRFQKEVAAKTGGGLGFEKIHGPQEIDEKMEQADIIHLHAPFLGLGRKLLIFKTKHPEKKIIVSLYRNLPYTDLFTIIIWMYNNWYLKKLVNLADYVCAEDEQILKSFGGSNMLKDLNKFISLTNFINFINETNPSLAEEAQGLTLSGPQLQSCLAYGEIYRMLSGD